MSDIDSVGAASGNDATLAGCDFLRLDGPDDECIRCDTHIRRSAGESLVDGENHWFIETRCPGCGLEFLECGSGLPPTYARSLIIEQTGLWAATVSSELASGTSIMRALRRFAGGTIADAQRRANQLRHDGLTGTHGEMLVLRRHLVDFGITTAITTVEA